ncbi:MAG TPA: IPExxxVDY family protein [Flavobacteriaceae bacterium]|jgi:hypothetical protein|nr:hypothetical protein [Flavobacteriaceae bacterium]MAM30710.1 hypothetical protein [Flavobacteriaceae bacterium]MAY52907.1 hypothetical protein [Flavobacteriaceae bacterium]HBR55708.1 IPExxxVDY family protein [Flavobacteriaceae bacterium]|tara:strand:+ start:1026 stop:1517 length:492 start_codon:yes stop_codon:yes gene_type:complete
MAHYKLVLEDDVKDDFSLVAIHCSEEDYKMAFLLNQKIGLRLHRRRTDLEFVKEGLDVNFALFDFEDQDQYTTYYLVANKCKTSSTNTIASGGLFDDEASKEVITKFLIPEFKKVDFFLKIASEYETPPIRKLLMQLNEIDQVISAYTLEQQQIKSKDNLIFD